MANILIIATSHDRLLDGGRTGLWLEEFLVPFLAFEGAGHRVTVASLAGGDVPIDPRSLSTGEESATSAPAVAKLCGTPAFDTLDAEPYDAVYLPGGHGTVFDMPYNRKLHDLLFHFEAAGRVIAAVCHAPAVFAGMRRTDGTPFIAGRRIAAFTDAEERAGHGEDTVPFLLETRLEQLGGDHVAAENFTPNAICDGRLITGQNPASSAAVARLVLERL
ncbi:Molecular chaperone Hsp31 and glyoxalase 3 [Hartmannibacter diazotrophicus]|uniref:Molecular chaperone Hsp31 and glyoxalase 3 n=1 Tax=Hartmannibacter diazotrophicus TaxID=1482074 RepID=A0A2C9D5M3_9HYPH|nr:type 1 glutamine amidotransferase domain-containing protein [Hartmannibacter diazotrophicus]SON55606.1 Molecular chaperone Hsp31 and glyoxalase 3 [Hartmannibacter diazotrophicus]